MTDNEWAYWEAALESPKEIGKTLLVSVDHPEQGFYRTRRHDQSWAPVAIWKQDGKWLALRDGKSVDAMQTWNWCCRHPVTSVAYKAALSGQGWPDDEPTVAAAIGMGHNVGDVSDIDLLRDQIEAAKQGAEAYDWIDSDDMSGKAQSLRARMNELAGNVDKKREELKAPHLKEGKAIDAEWMPLVKEAKAVADKLAKAIGAFMDRQRLARQRLELERQREEAERQREVERAREAVRAAEEAGRPVVLPPAPEPLPPLPPPPDDRVKGSYGRAAHVATVRVVTAITDQDALYSSLREHPDLRACLLDLAQRALKAGHELPGCTIEERAKVS